MGTTSVCAAELDQLRASRFDPAQELDREIKEAERLVSLGFDLRDRALRLAKAKLRRLTRRKS